MRNNRRFVSMFCSMLLITAVTMSGCGEAAAPASSPETEIALLEPVNDAVIWEAAARRTLYDAKVYSAGVFPEVREYSFEKDGSLDRLTAFPGESVKKGSVLAYADLSLLKDSIEKKEKEIQAMEESYEEYRKATEESLVDPEWRAEYLRTVVENLQREKPEEYLPEKKPEADAGSPEGGASGEDAASPGEREKNPEYLQWEEQYHKYEGDYRILAHDADMTRAQLEQRKELYELEHAYALKQLERMKKELALGTLKSAGAGCVVGFRQEDNNYFGSYYSIDRIFKEKGSIISAKDPFVAIGDMEHKLLKCQYINKITAANAKDMYALIDGKRYEIVYQPMDSEEYSRRSAAKETIYSTFELAEPAEEVAVGDFAVILVVNDIRENVLSVPVSALHKDTDGSFVYVMEGEGSTAVTVETGMSDGVYTEILSGIQEGDRVLVPEARAVGEGRTTVAKGSFHSNFKGSGYLAYPSSVRVQNPVTYGTTYFVEYLTAMYEHVEKGQVLARVRVQPDSVALKRQETRLERLEERLADQEKEYAEASEAVKESMEKTLEARKKEIEEARELLDKMKGDYATTEIRASQSGVVIGMNNFQPEDILSADALLVEIAKEDTCYVVIDNDNQLLTYGNTVTVSYRDKEGNPGTTQGMVANLSEAGAGSSMKSEFSLILLPPEVVSDMTSATMDPSGWLTRVSFQVEAVIREMNDVCVVPKSAVWEAGGSTYVFVVEADGKIVARSFVAGGYDASNYWVVEGLTEGTEICLK